MLALNVLLELPPQEGLCAAADWALNALLRVGLPCLSRYIFNDYLLKKRARLYDKRTSPNAAKPSGCCIRGAAKRLLHIVVFTNFLVKPRKNPKVIVGFDWGSFFFFFFGPFFPSLRRRLAANPPPPPSGFAAKGVHLRRPYLGVLP